METRKLNANEFCNEALKLSCCLYEINPASGVGGAQRGGWGRVGVRRNKVLLCFLNLETNLKIGVFDTKLLTL
jgi:hypothetical protein